jgi:SPP1 gp7 family putative phage head morphogenesis protein
MLIDVATRHAVHIERLKSGDAKSVDAFIRYIDRDIRARLAGKDLTEYTTRRLERLLGLVRGLMAEGLADYREVWARQVADLATYEAGFERRALSSLLDGVEFALPSESQLVSAVFSNPMTATGPSGGLLLEPFFERMTQTSIERVTGAIRSGYAQGQTTGQILQAVRGTRANGFQDGAMAYVKRIAETVARTSLQHAAVQAREQVWRENASVVEGVRWVSTLDNRTSTTCRSLDGREFALDKGPRPPAHPNCRSTTVAVLAREYRALSEGRTRAARNAGGVGSVSGESTYYAWLRRQPAAFQDSAIGPARGRLLRNGGLSAERFSELSVGKTFEPLTLDQMRNLEPVAFDRANL